MKKLIGGALGGLLLVVIFLGAYYIFQANGFSIGGKNKVSDLPQVSNQGEKLKNNSPAAPAVVLDTKAVLNAEYKFPAPDNPDKMIRLINGSYEEKNNYGNIFIESDTSPIFGDLDSDGINEAVVSISSQLGGTGNFRDLHILKVKDGKIVDVAQASLGDRIGINSVSISGSLIILDVVAHGPKDPMCCPASREIWHYSYDIGESKEGLTKTFSTAYARIIGKLSDDSLDSLREKIESIVGDKSILLDWISEESTQFCSTPGDIFQGQSFEIENIQESPKLCATLESLGYKFIWGYKDKPCSGCYVKGEYSCRIDKLYENNDSLGILCGKTVQSKYTGSKSQ